MKGCFFYDKDTHTLRSADYKADEQFFGFCVLKDYGVIYKEELPRFRRGPEIYALPKGDTPKKVYSGLCRFGLLKEKEPKGVDKERKRDFAIYNKSVTLLPSEEDALEYISLHTDKSYYRPYFTRMHGRDDSVPCGYVFKGFDVVYPPACDGAFSLIYDCFFICKRYGCDFEGKELLSEFERLNSDGLFSTAEDAFEFMKHYLSLGRLQNSYCYIYEVYGKAEEA